VLQAWLAMHSEQTVQQCCNAAAPWQRPSLQGVRRPPLPDQLGVKRALATHEAGKGLVATLLRARTGFLERIERVSMVPRGGCAALIPHIRDCISHAHI
jgi:hypothetical protein